MQNRKGLLSISSIIGIITIILISGIMLTVGLRTDDELQNTIDTTTSTITLTNATTRSVVNSSTGTYPSDVQASARNCALSVSCITNGTGLSIVTCVNSGNYTVTGCNIYFSSASTTDGGNWNNTYWNITGTASWSTDTMAYNATEDIKEGKVNISENIGLLGIIIIFGVIISIVTVAFMISRT